MNVTDIRIRRTYEDGKLKALVSVTIDQDLAVHDIKVIEGSERLFVAMPSRKDDNGVFRDIVHPITMEAVSYTHLDVYKRQIYITIMLLFLTGCGEKIIRAPQVPMQVKQPFQTAVSIQYGDLNTEAILSKETDQNFRLEFQAPEVLQ